MTRNITRDNPQLTRGQNENVVPVATHGPVCRYVTSRELEPRAKWQRWRHEAPLEQLGSRPLDSQRMRLDRAGDRVCDHLYQVAVISNADGRIKDVLRKCGIADCFRTITDSGLVGYEKPHPEIFRQALKTMNAAPEESLYVGDVYCVDYLGAYREKEVPRVESLAQLQILLGGS